MWNLWAATSEHFEVAYRTALEQHKAGVFDTLNPRLHGSAEREFESLPDPNFPLVSACFLSADGIEKIEKLRAQGDETLFDHFLLFMTGGSLALSIIVSSLRFYGLVLGRVLISKPQSSAAKVAKPPGGILLFLADFFFSPKTYTRVFSPLVSDMREEYWEELSKKRKWKARYVLFRHYVAFGAAAWSQSVGSGLKKLFSLLGFGKSSPVDGN